MQKYLIALLFLFVISNCFGQYNYPLTRTVDSSDTWHNVTIKDPYRWIENLKSEETQNWFKAQNDFARSITDKLNMTDELYRGLLKLDSIQQDKFGWISQVGNNLFYFNMRAEDPKPKFYKRAGENAKEELVADNMLWGSDYNLTDYEIDPYQKYIALVADEGGKEITVTKFYNIALGRFMSDSLPGRYAGYAPGEGNVYYMQQPIRDVHVKSEDKDRVFKVHKLGTDTLQDKIFLSYSLYPELYDMTNTNRLWPVWLAEDCNYEIISSRSVSPNNEYYYRKINSGASWKKIISKDDQVSNINGKANKLFFVSKKNAPNGKVLMMDMNNPEIKNAKLIAPEKDMPLQSRGGLAQSKNFLVLGYMKNGIQASHYTIDMRTDKVAKIPFTENTSLMFLKPFNKSNDNVHILRTGWTTPVTFSYGNLDKPYLKEKTFAFQHNAKYPYTDEVVVDEIEVAGHDGVMIPVSIIHKKGLILNGENIVCVNGYGAYEVTYLPDFSPLYLLLAHKGVVIVTAHVRGGGEKGKYWHLAGYKQSKPNTWKDLNSVGEYLISKGYTNSRRLACEGGSAGGILIGRAVTERPDLWACAVPQEGCLTMVRQEFAPNGPVNVPEFGTVKNINEFFALMEMDATLHVQEGTKYPAMLITTGWNDPRVISWQPAKFAAAVQKANVSDKPILLQVDYNAGHGNGEDKFADFMKEVKKWAFILQYTGYKR
jgi:prolyl oligopeptidase